MSLFAEATKKAASARFRQRQIDSEGQEVEVRKVQWWMSMERKGSSFRGGVCPPASYDNVHFRLISGKTRSRM